MPRHDTWPSLFSQNDQHIVYEPPPAKVAMSEVGFLKVSIPFRFPSETSTNDPLIPELDSCPTSSYYCQRYRSQKVLVKSLTVIYKLMYVPKAL